MTDSKKIKSRKDLNTVRQAGLKKIYPEKRKLSVSMATCGLATGAAKVFESLAGQIKRNNLDIVLSSSGCLGYCQVEPVVSIFTPDMPKIVCSQLTPDKVDDFMRSLTHSGDVTPWALCRMDEEEFIFDGSRRKFTRNGKKGYGDTIPLYHDVPFFSKQMKIVLRNCGFIDSDDIDEYIARFGYFSLFKVLTSMSSEEVIGEIKASGLRGRGGAGFPTGLKWEFCRNAQGDKKYVICNADEGDPGAYMDRSVIEGDPHSVIEGMLIGAYAIGAQEGIVYVRAEYPLAIEKLKRAIGQAEAYGFLGRNIFNTGFDFTIRIVEGAGAFVCGEETSLIASIEGRPSEPRPRPPFPAQCGLWGCPTNINNVETWANIPVIIARGAEWYAGIGTEKSKGTKVFSLVGAVNNTGLVEVPMGTRLREIVFDMGGGIQDGMRLKAIQTGGPSGGCIPAALADMPVDYEKLAEVGSIMGSGGMVVMDETNCMVDIAKFFTSFTRDESCGKCTSCRDGLDMAYTLLDSMTKGQSSPSDLELLEELSLAIKDASQCGLGTTAPNPILSTLRFFKDDYLAHIVDRKCPAKVCTALIEYRIDPDKCTGCMVCARSCTQAAISGEKNGPHTINPELCIKCGVCLEKCKFKAVVVE